jgi:2-C-methyl-D-erythritol 4-phosphate cytidylyltransferase
MDVAIITAAGKGTRLKGDISKQFMTLHGKPILAHTIDAFESSDRIDEIYITVPRGFMKYCKENIIDRYGFKKVKDIILGGSSRQVSVLNGLQRLPKKTLTVSIHDGVRPLVTKDEIDGILEKLYIDNGKDKKVKGMLLAAPAIETVKKIDEDDVINETIDRSIIWMAQTPQTFFYDTILNAHLKALKEGYIATDDASLVEWFGYKVKIFRGKHENIKVTTPIDLFLAEIIMEKK